MTANLISTYVTEVGRRLPHKNRADIEAEISSALQDMLEERSKQTGKEIDEKLTLEVIQDYGSPDKVAASYKGERYLIGPKLFPFYEKVLKIVLPILLILGLVGFGLSLIGLHNPLGWNNNSIPQGTIESILEVFGDTMATIFNPLITALVTITIVFAILERFSPEISTNDDKWEAKTLLDIQPPVRIKKAELITEIVASTIMIVVFNFFPQIIGYTPSLNSLVEKGTLEAVKFYPILSEAFMGYVPYVTALAILTIVMDILVIQRGQWETWTNWFSVCVTVLGIALLVTMISGPSLINLPIVFSPTMDPEAGRIITFMSENGIRLALAIAAIVESVELVNTIIRLIRHRNPISAPVER